MAPVIVPFGPTAGFIILDPQPTGNAQVSTTTTNPNAEAHAKQRHSPSLKESPTKISRRQPLLRDEDVVTYWASMSLSASDATSGAGRDLGDAINTASTKRGKSFQRKHVTAVINSFAFGRELLAAEPKIDLFLFIITHDSLHLKGFPCDIPFFNDLSEEQITSMADTMANTLRQRKDALTGFSRFKGRYPAVLELCARFSFLNDTFVVLCQRVLIQAPWGASFRISLGAGISVADQVCDVNMIVNYFQRGLNFAAWRMIGIVVFSMLIQLSFVYLQNKKMKPMKLALEVISVLLCFKPGVGYLFAKHAHPITHS